MSDLEVLATAATNDNLTAGSQFAAPAGDGKWAGSVTEIIDDHEPQLVLMARTFLSS